MKKKYTNLRFLLSGLVILFLSLNVYCQNPAGFVTQAYGANDLVLKWTKATVDSYQIEQSTDSISFTVLGSTVLNKYKVTGLTEGTIYYFRVQAIVAGVPVGATGLKTATLTKKLSVSLPLDVLVGGDKIKNAVTDSLDVISSGSVTLVDAAASGIGVPALKFLGAGPVPVASSIRLYKTVVGYDQSMTGRTMSFWFKNDSPEKNAVLLSFGKRAGGTVAIKGNVLYGLTAMRHGDANKWWADSTGVDFNSTAWTHVSYVFDNPKTRLFVNGVQVDESDGIGKMDGFVGDTALYWPSAWEYNAPISTDGKSAEIGCIVDNNAAMVTYLGDSWDPGLRAAWSFNGMLSGIKLYNYAMTSAEIGKDIALAPAGLVAQAFGPDEIVLKWTLVAGMKYQVSKSTDGTAWEVVDTVNTHAVSIKGLTEGTTYQFKVTSMNIDALGGSATVAAGTSRKRLVVDMPLNELIDGDKIKNVLTDSLDVKSNGSLTLIDAATSGLGVPAVKFLGDGPVPVSTYVRLYKTVTGMDSAFVEKTISFWMKNNSPAKKSVPISFGKRAGMTILLQDGKMHAFTKMRNGQFNKAWADSTGVAFNSSEWTQVTYVFDNPVTKLYVNGVLADVSDGKGKWDGVTGPDSSLVWPSFLEFNAPLSTTGASGEIGCLDDPCWAMVGYMKDTWDAGAHNSFAFNGMLAKIKMYNYAMTSNEIANDIATAPAGLVAQAFGPDEIVLKWTLVAGMKYQVSKSTDGTAWEVVDTVNTHAVSIKGLTEGTTYQFKVTSMNIDALGGSATVAAGTSRKRLVVDMPLNELIDGDKIKNVLTDSLDVKSNGSLTLIDAATSGLGVPAVKFLGDGPVPVSTYVRLYKTVTGMDSAFVEKTISFWMKNNSPAKKSVPISFGKRAGMTILLQDGKMHAFTKMRNGQFNKAWADSTGVAFNSADWTHVTYVFDNPVTRLYVNGVLADVSDGKGKWDGVTGPDSSLVWPSFLEFNAPISGTGASGEIGCLDDPCWAMVGYMKDTWDAGAHTSFAFNGMLAKVKMYNYALADADILAQFTEHSIALQNLKVAAFGPQDLTVTWTNVAGNTGYKVQTSENGTTWTDAATLETDIAMYKATGLTPATEYFFKIIPLGVGGVLSNNTFSGTTLTPAMVSHFDFAELVGGTGIKNLVDNTIDEGIAGQVAITAIPASQSVFVDKWYSFKEGTNAVSFTQIVTPPVSSYARLAATLQNASVSMTQRTVSMWLKNNDPALLAVPLSIGKRAGITIAFKDNKIHAFTKMRPGGGGPWYSDSTGAAYTSTGWTHIAYVYNEPVTKLYINGVLADESDGQFYKENIGMSALPYSSAIEIDPLTSTSGRSAEIGALYEPCASIVYHLGGNWDLGARNGFSGAMTDLRFYNYGLSVEEINGVMMELLLANSVDYTETNRYSVYPNPASDVLFINNSDNVEVSVIDNVGRTLINTRLIDANQISVSSLKSGVYYVKVVGEKASEIHKIMIVK